MLQLLVLSNDPKKVGEAYESQAEALNIFTELNDQQGIVNSVATMGRIALIKNDYNEAIAHYERAWKILEQTKYDRAITTLSLGLAIAHLAKQEAEAMPYLERFIDGVLNQEVTEHDINIMKDQFYCLSNIYNFLGLKVDRFEEVDEKF